MFLCDKTFKNRKNKSPDFYYKLTNNETFQSCFNVIDKDVVRTYNEDL